MSIELSSILTVPKPFEMLSKLPPAFNIIRELNIMKVLCNDEISQGKLVIFIIVISFTSWNVCVQSYDVDNLV